MDIENMKAAQRITAGQAVRTIGSRTVTPATAEAEKFHTSPFFGVALETVSRANDPVKVQVSGLFTLRSLGPEVGSAPRFGAVGINSSGQLVRATSEECVSAPNWIGDCDASGTVTIRPRRDTRLSVLDFGAVGNGNTDDADAIQSALDCVMRLGTTDGSVVYLPPGDYRIKKPLVISNGCILEGAGLAYHDETSRILADVKSGNFKLKIGAVGGETVYCAIALVGYATGLAMTPPVGRADYAVLRQLALHSIPAQGTPAATFQAPQMDGIRVMATGACIERMSVVSFRRNGIEISSSEVAPVVNASGVQIRDCRLTSNGQNGLDIGGLGNNNASNMLVMNVSATSNGRDGIYDNSFLGSTFVSCHTAANRRRNYSCEGGPRPSVYVGCYGEIDAPSVFNGLNIAVIGGDIDTTSDSKFWGFNPIGKGPSGLRVKNNYSTVHKYWIASAGVDIKEGERQTPGNGYVYRAIHAGRTSGVSGLPPEKKGMPDFPKVAGQVLEELDGLAWECEGEYKPKVSAFNCLGSDQDDSTIIQDYGYDKPDTASQNPFFRTQADMVTPQIKGRLQTSLTSGVDCLTYYQNSYENGPVPGGLMLPDAWIGEPGPGERRIGVVYYGTPFTVPHGGRRLDFYSPGDLLLNATGRPTEERQGGIGWAVKALCGRRPKADGSDWVRNHHYRIGEVVRPASPNGRGHVYRLTAYTGGHPYPLNNHSGNEEPSWNRNVGGVTPDKDLEWQTLYDLDVPANAWVIEPLPQRAKGQPDSAATDIYGLRGEFNALLAKMRKANLLE
ncbi:right-handed parallel beta-helix repeat-containing protein [Streptomyces virginiae]|uniref:right-handed parallel beta-helix repeat-containing protein n=1 Tax=Streptomyces virginiae TaxID=1961 RepID=UPI00225608B5|nr:right-handed parallel beta-helix repeat-containing protein [Streptomyces virginiae]MCX4961136.1 glycosyl hydrolase family 28-related protein [Streptomyces virginiae]